MFHLSVVFSSSHNGTILLLYADLFVGRVPLFALLLCVYVSPLMRFYSRTAVQMRTFHSIGTRAVPTTTSARRQIGQAGAARISRQAKTLRWLHHS